MKWLATKLCKDNVVWDSPLAPNEARYCANQDLSILVQSGALKLDPYVFAPYSIVGVGGYVITVAWTRCPGSGVVHIVPQGKKPLHIPSKFWAIALIVNLGP